MIGSYQGDCSTVIHPRREHEESCLQLPRVACNACAEVANFWASAESNFKLEL